MRGRIRRPRLGRSSAAYSDSGILVSPNPLASSESMLRIRQPSTGLPPRPDFGGQISGSARRYSWRVKKGSGWEHCFDLLLLACAILFEPWKSRFGSAPHATHVLGRTTPRKIIRT